MATLFERTSQAAVRHFEAQTRGSDCSKRYRDQASQRYENALEEERLWTGIVENGYDWAIGETTAC